MLARAGGLVDPVDDGAVDGCRALLTAQSFAVRRKRERGEAGDDQPLVLLEAVEQAAQGREPWRFKGCEADFQAV